MENPSRDIAVMFHCASKAPSPLLPCGTGGLRFDEADLTECAAKHNINRLGAASVLTAVAGAQQPAQHHCLIA